MVFEKYHRGGTYGGTSGGTFNIKRYN